MKPKQVLIVFMALTAGLLLVGAVVGSTASLADGPRPVGTLQVAEMAYSFALHSVTQPISQSVGTDRMHTGKSNVPTHAARPPILTSSNGTGWQRIVSEDFEGTFPPTGCFAADTSSTDGGEYLWGKRDCQALSGDYSIWSVGGGVDGQSLQCGDPYVNNLQTWFICGPFDLRAASDAEMQFALLADIEGSPAIQIDKINWGAAPALSTFGNYGTSGQTGNWVPYNINLTDVPFYGDLTGQREVYVDWIFSSDESNIIPHEGAFVDDVALWVYIPPIPTPPPLPTTSPITRHTTLDDFAVGNSHDGSMVAVSYEDGALALADQADGVGPWDRLPSLPRPLIAFAAVTAQGHLFIAGGNSPIDDSNPSGGIQQRVYSVPIGEDGRLGIWKETTLLPQALVAPGVAVANGHLFIVGGGNTVNTQKTVISVPVHPDGTLGEWVTLPPLPKALIRPAVVAAHGYLYALGGQRADLSASDKVYRAAINADGTIEDWLALPNPLPGADLGVTGLDEFVALAPNDYLYILGGDDHVLQWNAVFRARIHADGSLGDWEESRPLPQTLSAHAGTITQGGILITGGASVSAGFQHKAAYWATVQPDGSLGPWIAQPDLFYPMFNHKLVASETHIYNLGGRNFQNLVFSSVLVAPIQTAATQVPVGNFNHQFELGRSYSIKNLSWQEAGGLGQVQVRYRIASPDGAYGPWSDFTSTQPIAVNAWGKALEYQLRYKRDGGSANDKVITQIESEVEPIGGVYLPLLLVNH